MKCNIDDWIFLAFSLFGIGEEVSDWFRYEHAKSRSVGNLLLIGHKEQEAARMWNEWAGRLCTCQYKIA